MAGGDASTTDGAAGSGGSDAGQACNAFANTSGAVEQFEIAAAPPAQTGGAIAPGKYILTELSKYTGAAGTSGPTGKTLKETLMFTATTLDSVEAQGSVEAGVGADERYTYAYTAAGTTLALAPSCGPGVGQAPTYTAGTSDGGVTTLTIVLGSTVVTYTKQ